MKCPRTRPTETIWNLLRWSSVYLSDCELRCQLEKAMVLAHRLVVVVVVRVVVSDWRPDIRVVCRQDSKWSSRIWRASRRLRMPSSFEWWFCVRRPGPPEHDRSPNCWWVPCSVEPFLPGFSCSFQDAQHNLQAGEVIVVSKAVSWRHNHVTSPQQQRVGNIDAF